MSVQIPKVAVVVLNWNGQGFLEKFMPSVLAYSQGAEVYVVDNASTDTSPSWLQSNCPEVKIIRNASNEGFCRGYNLGLAHIQAQYYVLLNSDVEVTDNWLNPVIDCLDNHSEVAVCQPKIKSFNDKNSFEYAGAAGGFIDRWGYPFCRGRVFHTVETDNGQYDQPTGVTWASGACFFVRSEVFHSLGGFDEKFFAHMEEIDLCWRILAVGYKIQYIPVSTVYHVGAGTLQKSSPFKTFLNFRNGLFLLHKNLPTSMLVPTIFFRLVLDGVAGLQFMLKGQWADVWAIIRAHGAYYASLAWLNKRRRQYASSFKNVLMPYSTVWLYFVKGRKTYTEIEKGETK